MHDANPQPDNLNIGGNRLRMGETPEEKLAALLGGALEQRIGEKIGSFGNLLSRSSAVRLLCQENGISTEEKIPISRARFTLLPFSFSARVDRVFPVQQFPGGSAKSVRLHISDSGAEATLVLWNEQAKIAEGGIFAGDKIECSGAYFRAGEIAIGRQGLIARAGGSRVQSVAELREGLCNVQGTLERVEGLRSYIDKRSGERRQMLPFTLASGGKSCRAVWWSPPVDAPKLHEGAQAVLEGVAFRNKEIHLNNFSRILVQGGNGGKQGRFEGIEFEGGNAAIGIGGEKFTVRIAEALLLFGLSPANGVAPTAILSIKSSALAGKQVSYSVEGERLASLKFES